MTFSVHLTQQQIDAGFAEVVLNGNKEDVSFYVGFVSNPNIADSRYGRLPIWSAMEHEDAYDKTKIVLSVNPDVNIKNNYGQTPAMVALEKRMQGVGVLFLRHAGLDATITDKHGNDYMKYAVLSRSAKAVYEASKRGVPVDCPDKDGYIPAYWAVKNEDMDILKALYDCGMVRDLDNPLYKKVVKLAEAKMNDEHASQWLLAVRDGIFPESKSYELTQDWDTLLRHVDRLSNKTRSRVNRLLGVMSLTKMPQTERQPQHVCRLLSNALIEQCRYGNAEDVSLLLSLGADPNLRDKMGRTPLFCAVNYRGYPLDRKTPAAIAQTAYQNVKLLLESGANPNLPNIINNDGKVIADMAPLEQALYMDRVGIGILLIKAGAEMKTLNNNYPLAKVAAIYAKPEAIDVLFCAGCDLMARDKDGITPIEHAILHNKPYNVVMLRKHLISQGHDALFDRETPQGQYLYELASNNSLITEALNGKLSLPTDVKRQDISKDLSFEYKVAGLSDVEYYRLAMLAGVDVSMQTLRQENEISESLKENLPDQADNRHTVFRQALAAFKRKQRAKIIAERIKIKRDSRS